MNNGRPHTMRVRRRRAGAGCVERTDRVQLQRLSCRTREYDREDCHDNSWQSRPRHARANHEAVRSARRGSAPAAPCSARLQPPTVILPATDVRAIIPCTRKTAAPLSPRSAASSTYLVIADENAEHVQRRRRDAAAHIGMGSRRVTARCKGQITADISSYRALVQPHHGVS